jgi:hypothetical protein
LHLLGFSDCGRRTRFGSGRMDAETAEKTGTKIGAGG